MGQPFEFLTLAPPEARLVVAVLTAVEQFWATKSDPAIGLDEGLALVGLL